MTKFGANFDGDSHKDQGQDSDDEYEEVAIEVDEHGNELGIINDYTIEEQKTTPIVLSEIQTQNVEGIDNEHQKYYPDIGRIEDKDEDKVEDKVASNNENLHILKGPQPLANSGKQDDYALSDSDQERSGSEKLESKVDYTLSESDDED
tara:strand:+ start:83 stop:529 length:447 start_codon:yes stop_codon:yes gene_type:complete